MSVEWKEYRLGDVTTWSSGGTPSKQKKEFWNGNIPWISASSMGGNRYSDSENKITESGLKAGSRLADKDSILLLVRGSILHQRIPVGIAEKDVSFNQDVKAIRVKEELLEPWFLLLWFMANEQNLLAMVESTGIGAGKLDTKQLLDLPIRIPPKEIRSEIVAIGKGLDDKLVLNTQTNQTLEQIAQAIFKSWFVDFDPVKAKIAVMEAGGTKEQAELAAMSAISAKDEAALKKLQAEQPAAYAELAQTAALFPSKMVDSELGEIPDGWEVYALSALVNLTGGGTPKRSEPNFWGGEIPWFSVRDVPADGNIFVIDTEEKITELGLKKSSTRLLPQGTTIITARGTVGKLALLAKDMCMNQSCYGVSGKDYGPYFNYFYLSQAVATLKQNTHGAVFDTITTSTFDTYRSSFCGKEISSRFEATIAPLMETIKNNLQENDSLSKSRDALLPKLLSGELPTPETDEATA